MMQEVFLHVPPRSHVLRKLEQVRPAQDSVIDRKFGYIAIAIGHPVSANLIDDLTGSQASDMQTWRERAIDRNRSIAGR